MISSFVWLIRRSHIFSMLFLQTFYNDAHVNYFSFCHNFFFFFVASSRLQNFNCKTTHDKGKDEKRKKNEKNLNIHFLSNFSYAQKR